MKAWRVGNDDGGYVPVRANTRNQARRIFREFDYLDTRAYRWSELDGPGPARELWWISRPCTEDDADCWEGETTDVPATLARNDGSRQ